MSEALKKENTQALDRFSNKLVNPLAQARNQYGRLALELLMGGNGDITPLRLAFTSEVQSILDASTKQVIPYFSRLTTEEINLATKQTFEDLYRFWVNTRLFEHSAIIAETATNDVFRMVEQLIDEDATQRTLEGAIRDYSRASKAQARMIAATETHQAAMFAKKETATRIQTDSGLEMVKFWNAVEDSRTREDHNAAEIRYRDGIALDEKFQVGSDSMDRPGDPSASASNIIQCRCVLSVRPKGF